MKAGNAAQAILNVSMVTGMLKALLDAIGGTPSAVKVRSVFMDADPACTDERYRCPVVVFSGGPELRKAEALFAAVNDEFDFRERMIHISTDLDVPSSVGKYRNVIVLDEKTIEGNKFQLERDYLQGGYIQNQYIRNAMGEMEKWDTLEDGIDPEEVLTKLAEVHGILKNIHKGHPEAEIRRFALLSAPWCGIKPGTPIIWFCGFGFDIRRCGKRNAAQKDFLLMEKPNEDCPDVPFSAARFRNTLLLDDDLMQMFMLRQCDKAYSLRKADTTREEIESLIGEIDDEEWDEWDEMQEEEEDET